MPTAAFWGLVASSSLLLGALLAWLHPWSKRAIGLVLAFGAGVLIAAVAFDLVEEALERGGAAPTAAGLAVGALTYFIGDWAISKRGGSRRKHPHRRPQVDESTDTPADAQATDGDNPQAIVLGSVLDGIPESAAIGIALLESGAIGASFVVAVFLSNIPEALSASSGFARSDRSWSHIVGTWSAVTLAAALAAALGYGLLDGAGPGTLAALTAFAGGAVLTMVASTMLPEAHENGGPVSGLVTTAGFIAAVLIASLA